MYADENEEMKRFKVFLDNKQIIEEHNKRYKLGEVSYAMEINEFADFYEHEYDQMQGYNGSESL